MVPTPVIRVVLCLYVSFIALDYSNARETVIRHARMVDPPPIIQHGLRPHTPTNSPTNEHLGLHNCGGFEVSLNNCAL
jgi:hypothetical protein